MFLTRSLMNRYYLWKGWKYGSIGTDTKEPCFNIWLLWCENGIPTNCPALSGTSRIYRSCPGFYLKSWVSNFGCHHEASTVRPLPRPAEATDILLEIGPHFWKCASGSMPPASISTSAAMTGLSWGLTMEEVLPQWQWRQRAHLPKDCTSLNYLAKITMLIQEPNFPFDILILFESRKLSLFVAVARIHKRS